MDSYRLVMRTGPTVGMAYPLEKSEMYLGRDLGNDISINDPEISRRHARIFKQGANLVVEDLGSTNGTYINGQRLMGPYILKASDVVVFGENVSFAFEVMREDADATLAAGQHVPPPVAYTPQAAPQAAPQQPLPPAPQPYAPVQTPVYAGQVPEEYEELEPPKKKFPVWIIIIIALLLICCLCIGAFVLLDQFNVITRDMWCTYLGPVFNMISAGSCP